LSILDIRKGLLEYRLKKTIVIYVIITMFAVVFDKVYALFGHGVSSDAMTWMFLYPLVGGVIFYLLVAVFLPDITRFYGYQIFYNIFNSGIAALTIGSLLKGIMEIAGTSSSYLRVYSFAGYILISMGLLMLLILAANYKKLNTETINSRGRSKI